MRRASVRAAVLRASVSAAFGRRCVRASVCQSAGGSRCVRACVSVLRAGVACVCLGVGGASPGGVRACGRRCCGRLSRRRSGGVACVLRSSGVRRRRACFGLRGAAGAAAACVRALKVGRLRALVGAWVRRRALLVRSGASGGSKVGRFGRSVGLLRLGGVASWWQIGGVRACGGRLFFWFSGSVGLFGRRRRASLVRSGVEGGAFLAVFVGFALGIGGALVGKVGRGCVAACVRLFSSVCW